MALVRDFESARPEMLAFSCTSSSPAGGQGKVMPAPATRACMFYVGGARFLSQSCITHRVYPRMHSVRTLSTSFFFFLSLSFVRSCHVMNRPIVTTDSDTEISALPPTAAFLRPKYVRITAIRLSKDPSKISVCFLRCTLSLHRRNGWPLPRTGYPDPDPLTAGHLPRPVGCQKPTLWSPAPQTTVRSLKWQFAVFSLSWKINLGITKKKKHVSWKLSVGFFLRLLGGVLTGWTCG